MTKYKNRARKKVKIDIERINELLKIKKLIDSDKMLHWEQYSFVRFNVWDFSELDALARFGKSECQSNDRDYDFQYEGRWRTMEEMLQHQAERGAQNLAENEYCRFTDYKAKGYSQDYDLLDAMKEALKSAGYTEGLQIEGIEY